MNAPDSVLLLAIILTSARAPAQPPAPGRITVSKIPEAVDAIDTSRGVTLRTDGFYNTYDTSRLRCGERISDRYSSYRMFLVVNAGEAIQRYGATIATSYLSFDTFRKYSLRHLTKDVGTYKIVGSKLYARIPYAFFIRGMRLRQYFTNFEGDVKNRDTILNFHMVPPYPDAPKKLNNDFRSDLKPRLLYFIEKPGYAELDTLLAGQRKEARARR